MCLAISWLRTNERTSWPQKSQAKTQRTRANKNQTRAINKYISTAPYKSIWTLCWPNFIAFDTHPPTSVYIFSGMALILAFISCTQQGGRKLVREDSSPTFFIFFWGVSFNCNCRNPLPECRLGGDHVQRCWPGVYLFKTLLKFCPSAGEASAADWQPFNPSFITGSARAELRYISFVRLSPLLRLNYYKES